MSLEALAALVGAARRAGADAADALAVERTALSVQRRLGKIEQREREEGQEAGLRVFVGGRSAIVSTTRLEPAGFAALAERAVAMARVLPEDPFASPPDAAGPAPEASELELDDPAEPDIDALITRATIAEEAALAVPGVTNSEGATAGFGRTRVALVTSSGFAGAYARTSHALSAVALAGSGTAMERDYDFTTTVHLADLEDAAAIGRRAGERAVARLNPVRPRTGAMPVVYDPRVAASLLAHLASAINGASVARGTSFLRERLGQRLFTPGVEIRDDPLRRRGLRSRPFDAEGVAGTPRAIVADGVLTTWLLDRRSARQLGLASTGHASRSPDGQPAPSATNLWLVAGAMTQEALMADIAEGLYVTEMIGMGLNPVTGDYSRGAAGFMIRDGKLAEAVSGITVAGNLVDMFANLTPASDLEFRRGTDSPTVRIEGLTVAGA